MKEQRISSLRITRSILPALRTYTTSNIGIIGCHALKSSRNSCEYDLLVVGEASLPPKSIRVKDLYVDLLFAEQDELRKTANPEFAIMLSALTALRDNEWVLATAASEAKKTLKENCMRASANRLGSSLKALARVEENVAEGRLQDADLWLLSAGYDFSFATLYAEGVIPSPSHLLSQMKKISKPHARFKEWADAIGLPLAGRTTAENRLGSLSILYDVLRTVELKGQLARELGRYQFKEAEEIMKRKAKYLMTMLYSTEAYAYLGYEVVQTVISLSRYHAERLDAEVDYYSIVSRLSKGRERMVSEEIIKVLGLVRTKEMLLAAAQALKDSISVQARNL